MCRAGIIAMLVGCGARTGLDAPLSSSSTNAPQARPQSCTSFESPRLLEGINTSFDELCARLSTDELTLFFASDRGNGKRNDGWNIYMATRASQASPFSAATLVRGLNTDAEEACATLADDLRTVYFQTRRAKGSLQIWTATRGSTGEDFSTPTFAQSLPATWELWNPYVAGNALYMSGQEPGQAPHLYRAAILPNGLQNVERVDELVKDAEQVPVVTADETTLFFHRYAQATNWDVYRATRSGGRFTNETKVQELSSSSYDIVTWISRDTCRVYLTTDRSGGAGNYDIWVASGR